MAASFEGCSGSSPRLSTIITPHPLKMKIIIIIIIIIIRIIIRRRIKRLVRKQALKMAL
jgi:hypothetical protein